jgi:hypothetical protein
MNITRLSALATKRLIRIGELETLLSAERAITRAMSKLAYSPKQDSHVVGEVKRAFTLRDKLLTPKNNDT